ncbi:MAG: hypothetical protein L3J94_02810 [Gammaproteobacteria bacterium]|nr:hypothetical protein [Gammaproteobacteria bacterium]
MNIKLLAVTTTALMLLSTPLLADSSHHKEKENSTEKTLQSDGMATMEMEKMHQHMNEMKAIMMRIHSAENKQEKKKLLRQHMQVMHKGMAMMPKGMQGNMSGMMAPEKMKNCHSMMMQRMDMMQNMMEQMMEQMMQQQKMSMEK